MPTTSKRFNLPSKLQLTIRIVGIVLGAELLIMAMLDSLALPLTLFQEATLDAFALVTISTPIIYYWVVQPFVTAHHEAIRKIEHMACLDPLTQLANRRLITKHLEKVLAGGLRHNHYSAVMVMDLDGFKPINDIHGHEAGDAMLVEIARRLETIIRKDDIVGRLGGDEFIVILSNLGHRPEEAQVRSQTVAERLIDVTDKPYRFGDKELKVSASVGIRFMDQNPKISVDTLISSADFAMYQAKKSGKGCAVFFQE
ncbi:MAG: GGDEF domain-containing protein [Gammaproteobacteria bacterium]|nr:MAG: GGDEF domain-containing protein [Gammaproteobacteria bacterium]